MFSRLSCGWIKIIFLQHLQIITIGRFTDRIGWLNTKWLRYLTFSPLKKERRRNKEKNEQQKFQNLRFGNLKNLNSHQLESIKKKRQIKLMYTYFVLYLGLLHPLRFFTCVDICMFLHIRFLVKTLPTVVAGIWSGVAVNQKMC